MKNASNEFYDRLLLQVKKEYGLKYLAQFIKNLFLDYWLR